MKKISEFINRNLYNIFAVFILVFSAIITFSTSRVALIRLVFSVRDFGISVAYYFCSFFDKNIAVTVTQLPSASILKYLPYDVDEIIRRLGDMWDYVFNAECFLTFVLRGLANINAFSVFILLLLPVFILLPLLVKRIILSPNDNPHGEKSRAVLFFEDKILDNIYIWKERFKKLFSTLWESTLYRWIFIILWLINFNLATVVFEFLAFYFYFAFSFDLGNLPTQAAKLLLDVIIMFSAAPPLFWYIVAYLIICAVRKNIGYKRLDFREGLDREFIDRQPLIMMFTGTMGTGKTTALTSFLISLEIKFRDKALELMLELDSKYPNFPWIKLEDEIKKAIEEGKIKNLTTCRDFIDSKKEAFFESDNEKDIFGYDLERYR